MAANMVNGGAEKSENSSIANHTANETAENLSNDSVNGASKAASAAAKADSSTSRRASRSRSKATEQVVVENNAVDHAVKPEDKMSETEKAANGGASSPKAGKLELATKPEPAAAETGLAVHASGELEVAESYSEAGVRPIEVSHLEVYSMIFNNRPVSASQLQVVEYVGSRPVFASEIVICDDLTLPGGRPIVASDARLMEASLITGGRPIASNEMGEGDALMGYLD
jgi:hypothetical protein